MTSDLENRVHNRLKMRHFSVLLTLERCGSISRAAEVLNVSQPTLTKALADIEEIFRLPLFVRTGRGVAPTPAGRVVLERARQVAADNDNMCHELEGLRQGLQGQLRVGVIPYLSQSVASNMWRHLLELRPKLAVTVQEDATPVLIQGLRERTLDCAICRFGGSGEEDGLAHTILYREQPYLVVSAGCKRMIDTISQGDLASWQEMDWIFPPPTRMRGLIENMFAAQGLRMPIPRVETYSVRGIAAALSQLPRGISILPLEMATQVEASGAAVRSPLPMPTELPPVGLAWVRGGPKAPIVQAMLAALEKPQPSAV